jgi:type IV pilus biogenesis protein CpaD/CtpE
MNRRNLSIAIWLPALLLGGCVTSTDPTKVEDDFGQSVRQMITAQTYNPNAARTPAPALTGLDGVHSEAVLKTYREHVGDPQDVQQTLKIQIAE